MTPTPRFHAALDVPARARVGATTFGARNRPARSASAALAVAAFSAACVAPSARTPDADDRAIGGAAGQVAGLAGSRTETMAPAPAAQWVISCEPDQRARIRQTLQEGTPVAEVACVDARTADAGTGVVRSDPARDVRPLPVREDAGIVSLEGDPDARSPRSVRTQPAVYRQVEPSRPAARRPAGRSWQKSAVIIGSSAGVGAGIGAIAGGKKGALIGAAVGGGGAAIWDQVTRRKP
jgi:hypothetical protein